MPRDHSLYLEDIRDAAEQIQVYVEGLEYDQFIADQRTADAVVRNLEIIGEAVKRLPPEVTDAREDVDWSRIAGLRDILIHAYFKVDLEMVWDIIKNKLPSLQDAVTGLLRE
ncbi:MAG: DUF86 domain-containing protein [Thermoanaerobaculia bacterium]